MRFTMIRGFALATLLGLAVAGGALAQDRSAWPKTLTLGTASVGGTYFVYGQVWAALANEKIGTNISTQQTQGPNHAYDRAFAANDKFVKVSAIPRKRGRQRTYMV